MVVIDEDRCDLCGVCVAVCPENCMSLGITYLEIDDDLCTECNRCVLICPVAALEMYELKPGV